MRPVDEQQVLFDLLVDWREQAWERRPFFPASWILTDGGLELVSKTPASRIPMLQDLATLLEENNAWANKYGIEIFEQITRFEQSLKTQNTSDRSSSRPQNALSRIPPAKKAKGIRFATVQTPDSFSVSM